MKVSKIAVMALVAFSSSSSAKSFEESVQEVSARAAEGAKEAKASMEAAKKTGSWVKREDRVIYLSLHGYELKNDISVTFMTRFVTVSPTIQFFKKDSFGREFASSFPLSAGFENWIGCFADVVGDERHINSFVLKATVPGFVSKDLGYRKRAVSLVASTRITSPHVAETDIKILDKDGNVIDTLHDKDNDASPALVDSYKDFTEKSIQCRPAKTTK